MIALYLHFLADICLVHAKVVLVVTNDRQAVTKLRQTGANVRQAAVKVGRASRQVGLVITKLKHASTKLGLAVHTQEHITSNTSQQLNE